MTMIPQRHRQTDRHTVGQTTCHGNKALCVASRVNNFKLIPLLLLLLQYYYYDFRNKTLFFTNSVVLIWNSLPNEVVMADNIKLFKKRLDKNLVTILFIYIKLIHLKPEV